MNIAKCMHTVATERGESREQTYTKTEPRYTETTRKFGLNFAARNNYPKGQNK